MVENESQANTSEILLVGFSTCPFVHRVRFLLEEAGYSYQIKYANPYEGKPDWLLEISPNGKVPAIKHKGRSLYESGIIMEYLNDVSNGDFLPKDVWYRAQYRLLISKAEEYLGALWQLYTVKEQSAFEDAVNTTKTLYQNLAIELSSYYQELLDKPNLLSSVYAPILYKTQLICEYSGYDLFAEDKAFLNWKNALLLKSSFKNTVPENYGANTKSFIAKQNSVLAKMLESDITT